MHSQDAESPDIDPDIYTTYLTSLQSDVNDSVGPEYFTVLASFETEVKAEIVAMGREKASGPDKNRLEMLQVDDNLFVELLRSHEKAVGRMAYMPNTLSSAIVLPLLKKKMLMIQQTTGECLTICASKSHYSSALR